MPRGSYVISDVKFGCDYSIQPQVIFEVPLDGDVFYLGVLKLDVEEKILPYRVRIKSVEIFDEFDVAKEIIMNRYTDFGFKIEKSLIHVIPDKSPTTSIFPCGLFVPLLPIKFN